MKNWLRVWRGLESFGEKNQWKWIRKIDYS